MRCFYDAELATVLPHPFGPVVIPDVELNPLHSVVRCDQFNVLDGVGDTKHIRQRRCLILITEVVTHKLLDVRVKRCHLALVVALEDVTIRPFRENTGIYERFTVKKRVFYLISVLHNGCALPVFVRFNADCGGAEGALNVFYDQNLVGINGLSTHN